MAQRFRVATRGSEQAQAQATALARMLTEATGIHAELVLIETMGDKVIDRPISEIGGRGVFVKEVQRAVLDGRADLAVHSAKDLPSSFHAEGLVLAGVPERGDARDALAGCRFHDLRLGATVATGSQRRQAQLAALRPDLNFVGLRGNIPTRIARADHPHIDAIVVAVAGAKWVSLTHRLSHIFEVSDMVPQVGQGALAIECRIDDQRVRSAVALLEHGPSRLAVDAERSFLAQLGGGCELPVGAHARIIDGAVHIDGLIASIEGTVLHRAQMCGVDADLGARLARQLLAAGGDALLPS